MKSPDLSMLAEMLLKCCFEVYQQNVYQLLKDRKKLRALWQKVENWSQYHTSTKETPAMVSGMGECSGHFAALCRNCP
jgi:hypothetical protein